MKDVIVTCGGCHQGQRTMGVEFGYTAFLKPLASLKEKQNVIFNDLRDDNYFNDPIYGSYVMGNNIIDKYISNDDVVPSNTTLITLGGDHTVSFGSIFAAKAIHDNIKVIWIDAHPDVNTPESSTSGNCHGMPVAYLLGLAKHHSLNINTILKYCDIAYIGLRSIDPFEEVLLNKNNIMYFTADDVNKQGINKILKIINDKWFYDNDINTKVHVSLDIDSMDPKYTPATGTPVDGGITPDDVKQILKFANSKSKGGTANLDITEVNPSLSDLDGVCTTFDVCNDVISAYIEDFK